MQTVRPHSSVVRRARAMRRHSAPPANRRKSATTIALAILCDTTVMKPKYPSANSLSAEMPTRNQPTSPNHRATRLTMLCGAMQDSYQQEIEKVNRDGGREMLRFLKVVASTLIAAVRVHAWE